MLDFKKGNRHYNKFAKWYVVFPAPKSKGVDVRCVYTYRNNVAGSNWDGGGGVLST